MKHTILFLAANPFQTDRLALDQEARSIQLELERSRWADRFEFVTRWAAEPLDVIRELRRHRPTVVHFSAHGGPDDAADRRRPGGRRDVAGGRASTDARSARSELGVSPDAAGTAGTDDAAACPGLYFHGPDSSPRMVSAAALRDAFGAAGASVKLVVLSACYSEAAAQALLSHIDCVVGIAGSIRDDAARSFAIGFYGGLGERESVEAAYRGGCAAISLDGFSDADRPRLNVRRTVDPGAVILAALTPDAPRWMADENPVGAARLAADRQQHISIGRDTIGNVNTTGNQNIVKAHVMVTNDEAPFAAPAMVDIALELSTIRALLLRLESEHTKKIVRALDDADEEAGKNSGANKDELARALDRALGYARSATAFTAVATQLAPHVQAAVAWLGARWVKLLNHVA